MSITNDSETYRTAHSRLTLEHGPAGTVARIERPDGVDYAGPLPAETIAAIREVAR